MIRENGRATAVGSHGRIVLIMSDTDPFQQPKNRSGVDRYLRSISNCTAHANGFNDPPCLSMNIP